MALLGLRYRRYRVAERGAGREIEAEGDRRELLLVRDHQRRGGVFEVGESAQRHHRAAPIRRE